VSGQEAEKIKFNRRRIRQTHDAIEACQELARFLYPYPPRGVHAVAWWGIICVMAGVECEGEDLPLSKAMELYAFLLGEATAVFEEMNVLCEQKSMKF
jgi:hypothetical protein